MSLGRDGFRGQPLRLAGDTLSALSLTVVRLREPGRWWPVRVLLRTPAARGGLAGCACACASVAGLGWLQNSIFSLKQQPG